MATLILTETHNGQRFQLHVGDVVLIELPETSGAGYKWTLGGPVDEHLSVQRLGYRRRGDAVGGPGSATWELRVLRPGEARLGLVKARSWEKAESPADRFLVTLDIS